MSQKTVFVKKNLANGLSHIHGACPERALKILKRAWTETDEILKQVQNDK